MRDVFEKVADRVYPGWDHTEGEFLASLPSRKRRPDKHVCDWVVTEYDILGNRISFREDGTVSQFFEPEKLIAKRLVCAECGSHKIL